LFAVYQLYSEATQNLDAVKIFFIATAICCNLNLFRRQQQQQLTPKQTGPAKKREEQLNSEQQLPSSRPK
jgi:hypothetical protein